MRHEIVMPRMSEAVEEGVLVTWFVEPGALVREGDLVAEVQVEKAASEVRAPAGGRIGNLMAEPGGVVRQGDSLTTIDSVETVLVGPAGPVEPVAKAEPAQAPATATGGAAGGPVVASPAAKRLARELGVDIATVIGTGPGGRIQEADVRRAAAGGAPAARPSTTNVEPLSQMRRIIGERLRAGLASTAQLTITAEADVTDLAARLTDSGLTYTAVVVRACAVALRDHPRIASRWTPEGFVRAGRIDIGVAVALDDGLIVPVVRDADAKSIEVLGREIADLAARARLGRLGPEETEGGCFALTNLGAYRIDAFTPLLNPPQTAILGMGRARARPAVVGGLIVPRTLLVLSLTFDHQAVDGVPAAAFLGAVMERLEAPDRLFT